MMVIKESSVTHDGTIRVGDNVKRLDTDEVVRVTRIEHRRTDDMSDELIYTDPETAPWGCLRYHFAYTDDAPLTCQECGEDPCMCFDPARLRRGEI